MEAFTERASREFLATGEKVRKRVDETRDQLTSQEEQITRLARASRYGLLTALPEREREGTLA